jgi:D-alanine-D-alanine ligase
MHTSTGNAAAVLNDAIAVALGARDRLDLLVVCNRKGPLCEDDFRRHSLTSEFFSDAELTEILGSLRSQHFSIRGVFDEPEFIESASALSRPSQEGGHVVVINFASARLGPWGKVLLPAVAEYRGAITTNSDPYAMALARHKHHGSAVVKQIGVPTPPCWCFDLERAWIGGQQPAVGTTVLIQPAFESASIGVDQSSRVVVDSSLEQRVKLLAREFRQCIVVRQFIAGREVEVPVVTTDRARSLDPIGISVTGQDVLGDNFLTYDIVYNDAYGFYPLCERVELSLVTTLRDMAERVSDAFGLRGFSRVDFRVDLSGTPYVIDVAASPHFVRHSSFAAATQFAGMDPSSLPVALVGLALKRSAIRPVL